MRYLKFKADRLFTGFGFLDEQHVLITRQDGMVEDIVALDAAGDDVQILKGWLSPGFINCHCHLELSHMKGIIPERTGLVDFVMKVVTQRHFPPEEILEAIANAEAEMIANGIVAVGDICNNELTLQQKQQNNLHYYNFIEASGWLPAIAIERFLRSQSYLQAFAEVHPSVIVPHAPYSVSNELWQAMTPYFKGKVVSIHNQETAFEDDLFLNNTGGFVEMYQRMNIDHSHYQPTGNSSLQSYYPHLQPADVKILVHNTFTKEEDLQYLKQDVEQNGQPLPYFCLCANANLYIENALPSVALFRKYNLPMVLGTDSLASNHSLCIWSEIQTLQKHFNLPLEDALQWATINGAKALQMEDKLGSFAKGKRPGVVWIGNQNEIKRLL